MAFPSSELGMRERAKYIPVWNLSLNQTSRDNLIRARRGEERRGEERRGEERRGEERRGEERRGEERGVTRQREGQTVLRKTQSQSIWAISLGRSSM
jgi:hypothetical protein